MSNSDDPRFARIARDCREAHVPFPEQLASRFERVAKKLNEHWGKPPAAEYLEDLIFPSRPGRQGFPPEVVEEILALKNLHSERYTNVFQTVWDPFEMMYKDKSAESKEKADTNQTASRTGGPSIYSTRKKVAQTPAEEHKYSAMIAQLLPESVRKMMAQVRAARTSSGLTVTLPPPQSEPEELLLDAESLLEEDHFNSGTAILEQITTLFPDESPFAYLRLMEIYHLIQRREDFDWVSQRLSEQFHCDKVEWETGHDTVRANLDRVAESFLIAMRRQ